MAIVFFQQRKRQKYLALAFILAVLLTIFIMKREFWLKPKILPKVIKPAEVKINFEVLKKPILERLQSYEEIQPFEDAGRENPFLPY